MPKYIIEATRTIFYNVPVEANNEDEALTQVYDWISDDFEEFESGGNWSFETREVTENV